MRAKKKAKAGRPARLADSEKQRRRNVSLDDETVAGLVELGEGSLSEGIRRALKAALGRRK
jgi:hypothetical protein